MRHALWIVCRGFAQVCPVAVNTIQLSRGDWLGSFVASFVISAIWWRNAGSASRNPRDWPLYAFGAACGAVTGMSITRWYYGA